MLIIRKNQTNNLIATVSMNKTLPNPYYLFSFQHIASKERVSFIPQVITSNVRYDKFRFNEQYPTNLLVVPPNVYFEYLGQYYYSIYEQVSSTNLDPALAFNKLESGRAWVISLNDNIEECLFEPYISNDEDFAQIIYVSDEEQVCIPSVTPTQTFAITPTQTVTPSITPSNTETVTPSVTETPTNTPSNTETVTPSITPTITATSPLYDWLFAAVYPADGLSIITGCTGNLFLNNIPLTYAGNASTFGPPYVLFSGTTFYQNPPYYDVTMNPISGYYLASDGVAPAYDRFVMSGFTEVYDNSNQTYWTGTTYFFSGNALLPYQENDTCITLDKTESPQRFVINCGYDVGYFNVLPIASPTPTPTSSITPTITPTQTLCPIFDEIALEPYVFKNAPNEYFGIQGWSGAPIPNQYAVIPCNFNFNSTLYLDNGTSIPYSNTYTAGTDYYEWNITSILSGSSVTGLTLDNSNFVSGCPCYSLVNWNLYNTVSCSDPSDIRNGYFPSSWNNQTLKYYNNPNDCWSVSGLSYSIDGTKFYPSNFTGVFYDNCTDCLLPTPTPTNTSTITPSITPSVTETPSNTPTITPTNTETITPSVTETPTNTPSITSTTTPTNTPSNTETVTPSVTETPTNTPSNTETVTPSVTETPTNTPSNTETVTPSVTETPTNTPSNTETVTPTVTETPTNTPSNTETVTPSVTETPTNTPSNTETVTSSVTETPTNTPSNTETVTPSVTETPTNTPSNTETVTPTVTETPTNTPSNTETVTPTVTETPTNTPSNTETVTPTVTETPTNTPTNSATVSPTVTPTSSAVAAITPTPTPTVTSTVTPTNTNSPTVTPSTTTCTTDTCWSVTGASAWSSNQEIREIDFFDDGSLYVFQQNNAGTNRFNGVLLGQQGSRIPTSGGTTGIIAINSHCTIPALGVAFTAQMQRQTNGKYIYRTGTNVSRINADFTEDLTFNPVYRNATAAGNTQGFNGIYVNPSDEIFVIGPLTLTSTTMVNCTGSSVGYNTTIYKLNSGGTIDTTFTGYTMDGMVLAPGGSSTEPKTSTEVDPNGKAIVVGFSAVTGDTSFSKIMRLNTNGYPDTTFNPGNIFSAATVADLNGAFCQSDGKYLVFGAFTNVSGITTQDYLVRLNSDGSLDTTFTYSGGQITNVLDAEQDIYGNYHIVGTGTRVYEKLDNTGNRLFAVVFGGGNPTSVATRGCNVFLGGSNTFTITSGNTYTHFMKFDLNGNLNMCAFPTPTPTQTLTVTPTITRTSTPTQTLTVTPTITETSTPTPTKP